MGFAVVVGKKKKAPMEKKVLLENSLAKCLVERKNVSEVFGVN